MERFWSKVDKSGECWIWTSTISKSGYGNFWLDGTQKLAHRIAWVLSGNELIDGLQLDHLCSVRHCVNPDHLEQVTAQVNTLRSNNVAAINARKTHCPQGHEYDNVNNQGRRICRRCGVAATQRYNQRTGRTA